MGKVYLGIDTSNYRTSVAVVDETGEIMFNHRDLLDVPEGKRGLRQSEAFFQHVQRLPDVIERAMEFRNDIDAVSVSTRPRPREGSYMPCFTAGTACAREVASALGVPLIETSHQEGHVEAVRYYSELRDEKDLIFFHFSGGTTEALFKGEIVGGTKDISFGQVLDRIGVRLGYAFPSGEILDQIAIDTNESLHKLTPVKVKDGWINLSGLETQAMRTIDNNGSGHADIKAEELIKEIFDIICDSVIVITDQLSDKYSTDNFIFAGGVSASEYLRKRLRAELPDKSRIVFGDAELSGDNAVGVALIAKKSMK